MMSIPITTVHYTIAAFKRRKCSIDDFCDGRFLRRGKFKMVTDELRDYLIDPTVLRDWVTLNLP